jgi:hypothetical protein
VARAEELLTGLLSRATADSGQRVRFHMLARACLLEVSGAGKDLREQVQVTSAPLLTPRTEEEIATLAATGPFVLDMLPADSATDPEVVAALIQTAIRLGDDSVLPFLTKFAGDQREEVQHLLYQAWSSFDPVDYASVVLSCCPSAKGPIPVDLGVLTAIGHVPWLKQVRIVKHTCTDSLDVSPLAGVRGVTVHVPFGIRVHGADQLGAGSKVVVEGGRDE